MLKVRKSLASLVTFSLILLLLFSIFLLSFNFYQDSKIDSFNRNLELETLNSISSFRGDLIQLVVNENSTLNYSNSLDPNDMEIIVVSNIISGKRFGQGELIEVNLSSFSPSFCESYNFSTRIGATFEYNQSCISMSTS